MKKEMLINVLEPEECRIAILEDGVLEELYIERTSQESYIGNIYKGRIVNIEPSIQAAFVDFGIGRNGFLHVSDVAPPYYRHILEGEPAPADPLLELPDMPVYDVPEEDEEVTGEVTSTQGEALSSAEASASTPSPHKSETRGRDRPFGGFAEPLLSSTSPMSFQPLQVSESIPTLQSSSLEVGTSALPHEETPPAASRSPAANGPEVTLHEQEESPISPRPRLRVRTSTRRQPKPPIQEIFRRGQEVLVQVIKEGLGSKGPTLSTYISIPGRYLVLMPGLSRIGVSRKITDEGQRQRLRQILQELHPPKGLGFIIRTAGLDRTKKELQRDLAYLSRVWKVVLRRVRKSKAPALIYQESDMIIRTIRDVFDSNIETIWVDEVQAYEHAREFLQIVMPRYANRLKLYSDSEPLFHRYGIEREIARVQSRRVQLPGGASLVIDTTEALVAVDVNSGNFRADNDAEKTAYQVNLAAAKEVARQLRLRDLGGVIIIDFIDMREEQHKREVERTLREAVKRDRARTKILRMSPFCIVEMTRQRIRPSLKRSVFEDCPWCHGTGQVKTPESTSLEIMRLLKLAAHRSEIHRVHLRVAEPVAHYLLNRRRRDISVLEERHQMHIVINVVPNQPPDFLEIHCLDRNGAEVKLLTSH
ncbi:MAG: Rne/Rng family ribonuclease [Gemmatales bacterium]|nr:Rne/Rng family ribonuclease [Gemmatales bacterium]MCS7161165.1 Rne/Rng family ribonuclease [Gemmatales bacterium]MDW8176368.1 Rne/Rng family ribonuclease [Gemmatales bacterium]MDW8221688.1 Rne/Rng family ribonuclease [Gemmatales bacterium]